MAIIAVDTETTGLYWYKGARPFLFIAAQEGKETIVSKNVESIIDLLYDETNTIVFHNAKFDLSMLKVAGVDTNRLEGRVHDTTVIAHILYEEMALNLDHLARVFLGKNKLTDSIDFWFKANKINKDDRNYADVPDEIMIPYAARDAELTLELYYKLFPSILKDEKLTSLFIMEMDLLFCLCDMYHVGMRIDTDYFEAKREEFIAKIVELEDKVYEIAGQHFNMKSSLQLSALLIREGADLPVTDKGNYMVNEEVLTGLHTPLATAIVNFRKAMKLLNTYIIGMLDAQADGLIYPNLNTNGARTGRFSCSSPNLQNIPKNDKHNEDALIIRRGFIPKDDCYMLFLDYKQQEYRVFASYANEEEIIKNINDNDADYHQMIIDKYAKYLDKGDSDKFDLRVKAKIFNFLLIYGGGITTMSEKLGMSISEAKMLKEEYFRQFTNAASFFKQVNLVVKQRGYVINKFGRRRYLSKEAYKAPNFLVQGSCADYIKNVMAKLYKFLKPYKTRLSFQVHDELIIDLHKDELFLVEPIKNIMEDSLDYFKVKLTVDIEYAAPNWAEKKEWSETLC